MRLSCNRASARGHLPFAVVEAGSQCFCANDGDFAALRPTELMKDCTTRALGGGLAVPCAGNAFRTCGGARRLIGIQLYSQHEPRGQPWQDHTLPASKRALDLAQRLSPPQLAAQLYMNGADIYGIGTTTALHPNARVPGRDGWRGIFPAPPVPQTPSSAFPQPVNMGNSFDAPLVREIAAAISDEPAPPSITWAGLVSLVCLPI